MKTNFAPLSVTSYWSYLFRIGLPLIPSLIVHYSIDQLHLVEPLVADIPNARVKELSERILELEFKRRQGDSLSFSDAYPLLFRGAHLKELDPTVQLSEIQGRPEDTSYNGNVLHMSNCFSHAASYANCNRTRPFQDGRTGVMIYDTKILSEQGTFESDTVDGRGTKTPEESLERCRQVRWENYDPDAQAKRLSALIAVYFDGRVYSPSEYDSMMLHYPSTKRKDVLKNKSFVIRTDSDILCRIEGERISSRSAPYVAAPQDKHHYFQPGDYVQLLNHVYLVRTAAEVIECATDLDFAYNSNSPLKCIPGHTENFSLFLHIPIIFNSD